MVEPSFCIFTIERRLSLGCRRSHLRGRPLRGITSRGASRAPTLNSSLISVRSANPQGGCPPPPHSTVSHLSARPGGRGGLSPPALRRCARDGGSPRRR